jgi:actin-related protein
VLSADLQGIFDESLKTIERLLLDQIEHARRSNTIVDKVVLVGGFGDSPALKEYLKASLQRVNNQHRTGIELVPAAANTSATGVAIGAILRAQNKKNGPKRIPCRSVGVLFNVEYNPERYPQDVLQQLWSVSKNDGLEYITRTLRWVIKVVSFQERSTDIISYGSRN